MRAGVWIFHLLSFWQWSASDIVSNATRGVLLSTWWPEPWGRQMECERHGRPMTFSAPTRP
jgi:hypothetical protein